MDNEIFIQSLNQGLREDILINSAQEFIESLPENLRQEARRLRERERPDLRYSSFQNLFDNFRSLNSELETDRFLLGRNAASGSLALNPTNSNRIRGFSFLRSPSPALFDHHHHHHHPLKKFKKQNIKRDIRQLHLLLMSKDKNIINRSIIVDEKLIESVLKFIYTDSLSFSNFPYFLLRSIAIHPVNEFKIMDCFMFLLKHERLDLIKNKEEKISEESFPLSILYEKNYILKKYENVYRLISLKILYLMMRLNKISIGF